ncbi:MAG: phytoene/squalene synthase family protein [Candidatus Tectomicrobia bacterium]
MPASRSSRSARSLSPQVRRALLRGILKKVSRSFYLSLIVLPTCVREQVSLAYLFCRAADTLADTRILPHQERLQALEVFRRQFCQDAPATEELMQLRDVLLPHQAQEGERHLLHHLPDCFHLFARLSVVDQQLIRELVLTLTRGMEMDLTQFPSETPGIVHALPDLATLDLYTYYVAGVVGEFWTRIHAAHIPSLQRQELQSLCTLGVRFGKGLQMTNVLKDLGRDLHAGRCYLPEAQLQELQVSPQELLDPTIGTRIQPLIGKLTWYTLEHLEQARDYILRLPRHTVRLRLSCMWPLLFAVQTLEAVCTSEVLLHPQARVKISRQAVYRTMAWSLCCVAFPRVFTWYYARLRQRLIARLYAHTACSMRHCN